MKRLLAIFITPLLLASAFVVTSPHPVLAAQTPQQKADACFTNYDGKTYSQQDKKGIPGSAPSNAFLNSSCTSSNGGNCTSTNVGTNQIQVSCTKTPGKAPVNNGGSDAAAAGGFQNLPDPAYAAANSCSINQCGIVTHFVNPTIVALNILVGLAVVLGVIIGAVQVSSSAGDPQMNAKGKKHIRDAIIGLIAYLLLYFFIKFVIPGAGA